MDSIVRRDDGFVYWDDQPEALEIREQMLKTRLTIKYRMGGRWFKAASPPMNAYDSCLEVSRIYALPGVSRVMVYDENKECVENWCRAEDRRETKEDTRSIKSLGIRGDNHVYAGHGR